MNSTAVQIKLQEETTNFCKINCTIVLIKGRQREAIINALSEREKFVWEESADAGLRSMSPACYSTLHGVKMNRTL